MMDFPAGETIYVVRGREVVDPYSGETALRRDWSDPVITPYPGCAVVPRVSDELLRQGMAPLVIGWTVFSPHEDTDVTRHDRIRIRGEDWEVDGEPVLWSSPFDDWTPGWSITVKRREG